MEKQTLWKSSKSSVNLGKSSVYESIILFYTMKKKELPTKAEIHNISRFILLRINNRFHSRYSYYWDWVIR